eukprot:4680422-Alexandrium_andersonii.AAC.1
MAVRGIRASRESPAPSRGHYERSEACSECWTDPGRETSGWPILCSAPAGIFEWHRLDPSAVRSGS